MQGWPTGEADMARRIRSHDWSASPLGPIATWSERLKALVELVLASRQPMFLAAGPELTLLYNTAYADLLGAKHPNALGAPFRQTFAEISDVLEPMLQRVLAGQQETVRDRHFRMPWRPNAVDGWFSATWTPVRDEAGAVSGFLADIAETTETSHLQDTLRESEERQAFLLKLSDAIRAQSDEHAIGALITGRLAAYLKLDRCYLARLHPEQDQVVVGPEYRRPDLQSAVGEYRLSDFPEVVRRIQTETGVYNDVTGDPLLSDADKAALGAIDIGAFVTVGVRLGVEKVLWALVIMSAAPRIWSASEIALAEDVAERTWAAMERVRVEARLRESEARLASAFQSLPVGLAVIDMDGKVAIANEEFRRFIPTGMLPSRDPARGSRWRGWDEAGHPLERTNFPGARALRGEHVVPGQEMLYTDDDGREVWTRVTSVPIRDAGGQVISQTSVISNIDALKRSAEALRRSQEKYRLLFQSIDEGFALIEFLADGENPLRDFRFMEVNESFERQTGNENVAGKLGSEINPGVDAIWTEVFGEVARTGQARRFEIHHQTTGRWYNVFATRVGGPDSRQVGVVFADTTDQKEREERQAYLLKLTDALRSLGDVSEIQATACRLLGDHISADRTFFCEIDEAAGTIWARAEHLLNGAPPIVGRRKLADFAWAPRLYRAQELVSIPDASLSALVPESDRAAMAAIDICAFAACPIMRQGEVRGALSVSDPHPRNWTRQEMTLLSDTADRIWAAVERARAEVRLRKSEERFRQFAAASSAGLWIRSADTLVMEFVSRAITSIYGVEPGAILGTIETWAALIVPEDRQSALDHIEQARQGRPVVHEFRIQRPADGSFRWIRNTDFPLYDERGRVERVGGLAEDITIAKLAVEHQDVLLAELQHRVRNIMAMIRSVANRSADGSEDVEEYRGLLSGRLMALARVQALLTRQANVGATLQSVLESEIGAQAYAGQYSTTGPEIMLSPKAVEVLTLAFHELATNALKYGALSSSLGRVDVAWKILEREGGQWALLDWLESGVALSGPPTRRGFGSELIEARVPYELGGSGDLRFNRGGVHCRLEFPLANAESILETDAPETTRVYDGSVDMTGAPNLAGRDVLIVEDDYYMASDLASALRNAGANVLGPCQSEKATLHLLESRTPSAAVLDLNLGGGGPRFELAAMLRARGVPFIFLTGYDPNVIPPEHASVTRLQKPAPLRHVVETVGSLAVASPA